MAPRITGFLDFIHRPDFLILENTTFMKLNVFSYSDEKRETPTLLGLLERAEFNHWTNPFLELENTDPISEKLIFLVFRTREGRLSPEIQYLPVLQII
jgi:hypothetical protein